MVALPVIPAVYRYQTEFSGAGVHEGVQTGTFSFGSPVAPTVVPVVMPGPLCAWASARSSFGGNASANASVNAPNAPLVLPATARSYVVPEVALNWIRLVVPQRSSFEATGVRLSTDGPVYAARTVSKPAVQVSKRIFLLEVGVNMYQTDLNGPAPACGGSPVWVVAYVLSPDRVP